MQSPQLEATHPSSGVVLRQQAAHSSESEKRVSGKAPAAAAQPLTLPEDVVTLSSSDNNSFPKRKASQPVSNEEKQALLGKDSPRDGFSVYG